MLQLFFSARSSSLEVNWDIKYIAESLMPVANTIEVGNKRGVMGSYLVPIAVAYIYSGMKLNLQYMEISSRQETEIYNRIWRK